MVTPVDFHTKEDQLSFMVRDIDIGQAVSVMGTSPARSSTATLT